MAEALEEVKRQYGRSAVILNTRTVTKGGLLGLGGKPCVEITAARAMADLPAPLRRGGIPRRSERIAATPVVASNAAQPAKANVESPAPDALVKEVGALRSLVGDLVRETRRSRLPTVPAELHEHYQTLVENRVAEELAARLVEEARRKLTVRQLREPAAVRGQLAASLAAMLPTGEPIRVQSHGTPYIVALIGPTGVGKTTTIAKLAANFCLRENRKVGLITIDTYRIAAVEQLKTYAQIIDVPLEVAMSPDQMKEAVGHMADRDVILIDTAGRGQRDAGKLNDLLAFFTAVKPHEVHLVLSATCEEGVLSQAIERFSGIGIDRVIFTKLDEAVGFGVILNCLEKAKARLSYVTMGQEVPNDIEVGAGRTIAGLILGNKEVRGGRENQNPNAPQPVQAAVGNSRPPRKRKSLQNQGESGSGV